MIPGSGSPEYVLAQLAKAFNARQSQHRVVVPPSTGTAGALRDVGEGISPVGRVGRLLKDDESRQASSIIYIPLGRDPVVVVAGAGVTVRDIAAAQMVDIYTGKIGNWSELGGKAAPIRAVGRGNSDASRQALNRVIKPFKDITFAPTIKTVHLDPHLIALLDRYPTSLGFPNGAALVACTTRVVHLTLDGIAPTPENVDKGALPGLGRTRSDPQAENADARCPGFRRFRPLAGRDRHSAPARHPATRHRRLTDTVARLPVGRRFSLTFTLILLFGVLAGIAQWSAFQVSEQVLRSTVEAREIDKGRTVGREVAGLIAQQSWRSRAAARLTAARNSLGRNLAWQRHPSRCAERSAGGGGCTGNADRPSGQAQLGTGRSQRGR